MPVFRSLSFIYLFVVLAVGYIGGALLFREVPADTVEKWIFYYDVRVVKGKEASFLWPIAVFFIFYAAAFFSAFYKYTRFLPLLLGALKSVLFGLASSYLVHSGMTMFSYTLWWFPSQFLTCFLFLMYANVLAPPFFLQSVLKGRERNSDAFVFTVILSLFAVGAEMLVYYVLL